MLYQINHLQKAYKGHTVLHIKKYEIKAGINLAVVGPNGSGKSTLLEMLAGLLKPTAGSIEFMGAALRYPLEKKRRAEISYLAQEPYSLPGTVLENVKFALATTGLKGKTAEMKAFEWLERIGLESKAGSLASALSVSQTRRVALARNLCRNASLWILDEPYAFGDEAYEALVFNFLKEHRERGGTTIQSSPIKESTSGWASHTIDLGEPTLYENEIEEEPAVRLVR